jgi:hypothetical protein
MSAYAPLVLRALEPVYTLYGRIVVWRCSLCRKLFLEFDAGEKSAQSEFDVHSCEIHLIAAGERLR